MKFDLDILEMSRGLGTYALARQGLIAQNIANADTPGYRARDLDSFASHYESGESNFRPKMTRLGHFDENPIDREFLVVGSPNGHSLEPNGNNVELEEQMIRSIELREQHQLALGVFQKSLDLVRTAIGRGR